MARRIVDVKFEGLEEVMREFNRFDKESRVNLRRAVRKNVNSLRKGMRSRIHNVTGNLSKSISAKYDKDGFGAVIGPTRPLGSHAHLLEFGTVKMAARPFVTPAVEEQRDKYLNDVRAAVRGAIKS